MRATFETIIELVSRGEVRISAHGYDELAEDDIFVQDVVGTVTEGVVVEDYPNHPKGPCCLVLQEDRDGKPIHIV